MRFTATGNEGAKVASLTIANNAGAEYIIPLKGTVNSAPAAADKTLTVAANIASAVVASDFGFSDVNAGDTLQKIQITKLPLKGALKVSGIAVTLSQQILVANLAGNLTFTPYWDESGTGYANFEFKVSDGLAYSATAKTITLDVSVPASPASPIMMVTAQVKPTDTVVGTLKARNPLGHSLEYALITGYDSGLFGINPASGALTLNAGAGAIGTKYRVDVKFTDTTLGSYTDELAIEVEVVANPLPIGTIFIFR